MKRNVNSLINVGTNMNVLSVLELIPLFIASKNYLLLQHLILEIIFALAITPVKLIAMLPFLKIWPELPTVDLIINGFSVGFILPEFNCCFPNIVSDFFFKEVTEGRVDGPFLSPPFRNFRVSPLGLI